MFRLKIRSMLTFLESFKKLFVAAFAIFVMGYIGNLLIDNPYVHGILRREINRNLEKYTFLSIQFEAISAKFIPLGFDIYGIEVRQKNLPEAAPLVRAMHLQMRVSFWALLLSKRELLELEINGPKFEWPLPPLDQLLHMEKFPELAKKNTDPTTWPPQFVMPLHKITWTNAAIRWSIPDNKPELPPLVLAQMDGFDLELIYRSAQSFDIETTIQHLNVDVEGKQLIKDTKLEALLHQNRELLSSEKFELNSSEIALRSQLKLFYETKTPLKSKILVKNPPRILEGLRMEWLSKVERGDIALLGRYLQTEKTEGPLSGQADLFLHIPLDEKPVTWHIEGKGISHQAKLDGFKLLDSQLDFRIDEQGMNFTEARVLQGEQLLARGKGFLGFTKAVPFNYNIVPEKLTLQALLDVLQVEDFTAVGTQLESEGIRLQGQAKPFSIGIEGDVNFKNLTLAVLETMPKVYLEPPSCRMQTKLTVDARAVTIDRAQGQCRSGDPQAPEGTSPLQMKGSFAYSVREGLDFQLASSAWHGYLINHFAKKPATGLLNATVRLQGPYDHIVLSADAKGNEINIGGFAAERLDASVRFPLDQKSILIPHLKINEKGQGQLLIRDGTFGIEAPYPFRTQIDVQDLSSDFLSKGLEQTAGLKNFSLGIRTLQGELSGELMKPFAYQGKVHFVAQNLFYDQQRFFQEASGTIVGDAKAWSLQSSYFRLDQLEARTDIDIKRQKGHRAPSLIFHELGIGPDDQVHLHLKTINKSLTQYRTNDVKNSINHLASLPYIGSYFKEHNFGGIIQFDSELEGPIDRLQGKVEGALEQPFIWGIPISSFYLSGFVNGWELHIPELKHSGNALVGRLNIDFGKKGLPYDWYFYLNQLDIRAFLTPTFADDPRNFAYLSAEWTMNGKLEDFWGSQGELVLSRVRSKFFRNLGSRTSSIELNSDQAIRVQIKPEQWRLLDKRPLKLKGEFFDLELSAGDNRLPGHLDLSIQGTIKLDILKNFTHLAETARGEILVEGYVRGSISHPDLSLRFRERKLDPFNTKEWAPLSVGLVDYGPPLTSISLDVELKSDRVIVHKFHANKGREGTIDITGILSFADADVELTRLLIKLDRIELNRLAIPVLKSADLIVSGDLTLSGNQFPFSLAGNLRIDRFYSLGNFDLRREIVASLYETRLNASVHNSNDQQITPFFNLDVGVVADKSIVLKNKNLEVVLSANLRVRGTEAQPLLLGQIIADRGSFSYRRLFKINQAVISFDEPVSPPNPRLDIIGETTVNPYQVQVMVNGDLANPKVTLTCDPPNRDDGSPISNLDIVLLISTGKIPDLANRTAERASVNEIFSSFLVFAEEPIEKLFDLSGQTVIREVYIDSYLSEAEQRPITRLNVPFNLWGRANAVVQVDDESNTKLSFEYPIHEGITFSGSLDSKKNKQQSQENNIPKDTGFDLKFRFGFE